MSRCVFGIFFCCITALPVMGHAQSSPLRFKQDRDDVSPVVLKDLTAAELANLGDPLFNLVLKDQANLMKLKAIEDAIQPDVMQRQLFVVSERIASRKQDSGRRTVHTFSGTRNGNDLQGNVMLSASFGPTEFAEVTSIEAWGWDQQRQRYNYYKLDSDGAPAGKLVWKFRISSERAEVMTANERQGTCLRCHTVGAPVMKELFFPWNNWHAGVGNSFIADYLVFNSTATDKWPVATSSAELKSLTGANVLEDDIMMPAIRRFSLTRLNTALKLDATTSMPAVNAAGNQTVVQGNRLLKPLFEPTDVNFYSSRKVSGIHPLGKPADFVPASQMNIPVDQFFLNTDLIAGGGEGKLGGLGLDSGRKFQTLPSLTQQENKDLVAKFNIKLANKIGDTHFAWLVPGTSFGNNDLIDQCLQQGVVTPHFLAAALAVDVETPVFSDKRSGLQAFIPDQFDFSPVAPGTDVTAVPRDASKDLLTTAVIAKIDAAAPVAGSPADDFRTLLKSADAVKVLDQRVKDYFERVKGNLDIAPANAMKRKTELERLFQEVIRRRKALEAHPVLQNLDETQGKLLLPLP